MMTFIIEAETEAVSNSIPFKVFDIFLLLIFCN